MLFLWWSSSRQPTAGEASAVKSFLHNGAHIVAYGALATAWWTLLVRRVPPAHLGTAAWLVSVTYGVVDELHQAAVPGRTCSVTDLGSDAAGAWLAILCLNWLYLQHGRARALIPLAVCVAVIAVSLATFVPV
jgi:VanZ family protein